MNYSKTIDIISIDNPIGYQNINVQYVNTMWIIDIYVDNTSMSFKR